MKKKLNAFMLFSQEHREEVKEENPGAPVTEVAKILGLMWRSMADSEKAVYKPCSCVKVKADKPKPQKRGRKGTWR